MALLFWDASALVKRYFVEVGSQTVDALLAAGPRHELATTPWGYAETYSVLLRRLNSGVLDRAAFTAATTALQAEVVLGSDFSLLSISDATVFASTTMMSRHNINATDAAILTLLLEYSQTLPRGKTDCVIVAADRRLLRAADTEGLGTIDPEALPVIDVPGLLARL
jgi:predicted nucleic acid-binding protein